MTLKQFVTNARPHRRAPLGLLMATVALSACIEGDVPQIVEQPDPPALMERYVALGNSLTAGFQSGGLHEQFQEQAYPVLLAARADARFVIPAIQFPGCPVPLAAPLSTETIDTIPGGCAGRVLPAPAQINNLAVPGAAVADVSNPLYTGGGLATILLGGQTQLGRMLAMDPTLVSVWIGNNDALGAALSGDTTRLTPLATFQSEFDEIVAAIGESTAEDAILIGVANAMAMAPALQPGAYFWAIDNSDSPYAALLDVNDNCAPGTAGGSRLVSFLGISAQLAQNPGGPAVINCDAEAPFVLNTEEMQAIGMRVAMFNAHIEAAADANGWIYIDPMVEFVGPALADPDLIRKCQGLATASTPEEFGAAVQNTCPGPTAPNFFGAYFSFDGVHPSAEGHVAIADALAIALNEKHDLGLPLSD